MFLTAELSPIIILITIIYVLHIYFLYSFFWLWLEIWPEPDLAGFPIHGRIPDLPEPELNCGTILYMTSLIYC